MATEAGVREAKIYKAAGKLTKAKLGMGAPRFGDKDIPVLIEPGEEKVVDMKPMITCAVNMSGRELQLCLVSMGNTHAVYFSPEPVADFPLLQLGPKVEHHKIFPRGTNFEVAQVVNRKRIEARVWERGGRGDTSLWQWCLCYNRGCPTAWLY